MPHLPSRVLAGAGLLAAASAAVLTLVSAPAAPAEHTITQSSSRAAVAVAAATTRPAHEAVQAVPEDFDDVMGYRPRVRDGLLVDPAGTCSSPIPLPAGFSAGCAEHDLGYDLLRYAERTGAPLGGWARRAVDDRLDARMRTACAHGEPGLAGVGCTAAAGTTSLAVGLNSVRQMQGVPEETPASWAVTGGAGLAVAAAGRLLLRRTRVHGWARGRATAPAVVTTILGGLAVGLSLVPSLLPRPAWVQAVLTGLLLAVGTGLARPLARLENRLLPPSTRAGLRWPAASAATVLVAVALASAAGTLADARRATGMDPPEALYWPTALAGAALTCAVALALAKGARRLLRKLTTQRALAALALCVVVPVVTAAAGASPLLAAFSLVPVSGDSTQPLEHPSPRGAVRVYVGFDEADTPTGRAALAVRRLDARGAFDREAVVIAFPTGSGWVNPAAVNGFERHLAGDVATVAVQGGTAPSGAEMLLNRDAQNAAARALLHAVARRLEALPERSRPGLHLYGESLGALLGRAVTRSPRAPVDRVCSTLWAGIPGGGQSRRPGERVLRNADDPVVFWGSATAVSRPASWPEHRAWVPGLSYLTTSLDLLASLRPAPGHGHVYGPEQDWRLPRTCP